MPAGIKDPLECGNDFLVVEYIKPPPPSETLFVLIYIDISIDGLLLYVC